MGILDSLKGLFVMSEHFLTNAYIAMTLEGTLGLFDSLLSMQETILGSVREHLVASASNKSSHMSDIYIVVCDSVIEASNLHHANMCGRE